MRARFGKRKRIGVLLAVVALGAGTAATNEVTGSENADSRSAASQPANTAPIVVEFYTSQGCSSCPPADRYLTELAARKDVEIIPLSFHVDYWNYIGWTDPFSSKVWSERQRRYAKALGSNRVYTPQMIINGRWEGVGSDRSEITRLLERARSEPGQAEMSVSAELVSEGRLRVVVKTHRFDPALRGSHLTAWVAVVESGLVTRVGRGENASKSLRNDQVVRHLEEVSELAPVEFGASGSLEIALGAEWRRDGLSVVTFLQDTESLRIHAAATCGLTS